MCGGKCLWCCQGWRWVSFSLVKEPSANEFEVMRYAQPGLDGTRCYTVLLEGCLRGHQDQRVASHARLLDTTLGVGTKSPYCSFVLCSVGSLVVGYDLLVYHLC